MAAVATEAPFHVLAVDDSLPDRKLIERLLKTSSFQVTTVDSGTKALQFLGLEEHRPVPSSSVRRNADQQDVAAVSLIITDYCMPGMTGYDLLKKIKESSSLRDIPVVIMSSENIPSRINRCLEEGADEFFLKPVRLSDMSKLKPHIMKSRCKEHNHQEQHQQIDSESNESSNPTGNNSSDSSNNRKRKAADTEPRTHRHDGNKKGQQHKVVASGGGGGGSLVSPANSSRYLLSGRAAAAEEEEIQEVESAPPADATKEEAADDAKKITQAQEQVVVLKVSLHCKACAGKVKKHLSKMEGVKSFDIDFMAKKVTVVGDVTPLGVLNSVSKVKNAQLWGAPPPAIVA